MGRIPDEIIQRVRDHVDMIGLVGRFVTLKKSGRNYKGLCPFHNEKTPSFHVNPERQSFHCFGCQEGGNAFTFLMKMENLTFPEAVRILARESGIEVPESESGDRGVTERIYEALEATQEFYRAALRLPGSPGLAYLKDRGIDAEGIEQFEIGFAPDRWDAVVAMLRERDIPANIGEQAGLLVPRSSGGHYDRLRGRVTFPIQDVRGRVIGFGGRAIGEDQQPKYLNTPESPVFRKREALYGFPRALEPIRRTERAVVVEGYFDQIGEQQAYWLGFLQGDGSITTEGVTLRLKEADRPHVVAFRDALGSMQSIDENTATMRGKSFVNYSARIYSVRLVRRLGELGLRPRKTFDSEFPDYLTPDLLPHWLRGLFDADGCIHRLANTHSLMWSLCGYEDLMVSTRAYIERVTDQGRVKLSNQPSCDSRWASFSYGGITTPRALYRHMYEDATVWLGRKRDIFEQCFRDREIAFGEVFVPAGIRVPIEVLASQMSVGVS